MGVDAELDELLASADRGMAVAWHARRRPATPALITPAATITYGELNKRANRLARAFRRRGLRRGDAVALLCSNRPEFVEVLLATQRSGLRLTTVNWHLTADEAGYIVDDCEARAFVGQGVVEVVTANGKGTRVIYNGVDQGLMGQLGQVVDRLWTLQGMVIPSATVTPTPSMTPTSTPAR